jgi:2,3-bisphosphoglycerate-independent phosphoglycerate mutase
MKYVIIIPDGAADKPIPELAGKTPLQAAHIASIDRMAREGRCGVVQNIPDGMPPGSDVAIMSLVGYDPTDHYSGRAPLEAAALGIETGEREWIFRCNLVEIRDGIMRDHSAGNISNETARKLIGMLNSRLAEESIRFYSGVSYRNLMVIEKDLHVTTTPPHDILDRPCSEFLPKGRGSAILRSLIEASQVLFKDLDNSPATSIWLWGEGKPTRLDSFKQRFGIRGAVVTAVDLVRGIGKLIGWDVIDVPGATGWYDTDYRAKGEAAIRSLEDHDLACIHIEATDEAGHEGNVQQKIASLEKIDTDIVEPVLHHLGSRSTGGWRALLLPDHPTPCAIRTHILDPVPFCLVGSDVEPDEHESYSEAILADKSLSPIPGHELMGLLIS